MLMRKFLTLLLLLPTASLAAEYSPQEYIKEGRRLAQRGQHFTAARYYFQASQRNDSPGAEAELAAMISRSLVAHGLPQSATYFFLKAVSSGNERAVQLALQDTGRLINRVGGTIFKKYLLKYTRPNQYTPEQRSYYLYFLGHDHLYAQHHQEVVNSVDAIPDSFDRYPEALFLRGTAFLSLNQVDHGIDDFRKCVLIVEQSRYTKEVTKEEVRELKNRCIAGVARGLYQARRYGESEEWYERIDIQTQVWPQVQYERAWNAVARGDYNRALGRLVTYKSPALSWFHDSEIELLRSLSYLQMCIYDEVDKEANAFTAKYGPLGDKMKQTLQAGSDGSVRSLVGYFRMGQRALEKKFFSDDPMDQVMNRFVRSPHFLQLSQSGSKVRRELNFLNSQAIAGRRGLGGFLRDVLNWRWQTAQEIGGAFIRDRISTEYQALLGNVRTMDIVKLEMLRRAKGQLEQSSSNDATDVWGNKKRGSLGKPPTKDNQYFWDFNGEFWADELGEYVFSLRPECG